MIQRVGLIQICKNLRSERGKGINQAIIRFRAEGAGKVYQRECQNHTAILTRNTSKDQDMFCLVNRDGTQYSKTRTRVKDKSGKIISMENIFEGKYLTSKHPYIKKNMFWSIDDKGERIYKFSIKAKG